MFLKKFNFKLDSYKARLTFFNTLAVVLAMLFILGVLFYAFKKVAGKETKKSLWNHAKLVARIIDEDNNEFELAKRFGHSMAQPDLQEDIEKIDSLVIVKEEGNGQIHRSSRAKTLSLEQLPFSKETLLQNTHRYHYTYLEENTPFLFVHYRYEDSHKRRYKIFVGYSLKNIYWAAERFLLILIVWIPVICILCSLLTYFISKQGLSSLDHIILSTEKIGEGNFLPISVSRKSPREIRKLAKALNQMLEELKNAFEREKQFSAAASHELKTPLTALKGSIEVALSRKRSDEEYRKILGENLGEVNSLITLTHTLLMLSKMDTSEEEKMLYQNVDVGRLLEEVREEVEESFKTEWGRESSKIEIEALSKKPLLVRGNKELLSRALFNLLLNALQHAQAKTIWLKSWYSNGALFISVCDNGKGILQQDLPFLFDRFYRGDKSRSGNGFGLGLSLVKAIVEWHHGTVSVQSQPGKGTQFTLTLKNIHL